MESNNDDLLAINTTMMLDELLVMGSNLDYIKYILSFTMGVTIMMFCAFLVLIAFVAKGNR